MNIYFFCHSILSDWNHGNAHFLRGIASDLTSRGHRVRFYEDREAWSAVNLSAERGEAALLEVLSVYPCLDVVRYDRRRLPLEKMLDGADLVIVHEWSPHDLVRKIGERRRYAGGYRLLFHDTHHRSITDPDAMAAYDLRYYDGALVFGEAVRSVYVDRAWADRVWTWHEAADVRVFRPAEAAGADEGDLVWIGNWGDEERTNELQEFLIDPVRELRLAARAYGVRYPAAALELLERNGLTCGGWIPNYRVPDILARFKATVHIPRRPYAEALPGIPTIRVFEALACGIPLLCSPWDDAEGLFTPGEDFLVARNGADMKKKLTAVLNEPDRAEALASRGLQTILARHTCGHRVDELLRICAELNVTGRLAEPCLSERERKCGRV